MRSVPKLSIIVPVYNVADYLEDCLDSILAQTFSDFELILVDDGATDGSGFICDAYASADQRVKVIHKSNGGTASARNAGIEASKGQLIGFVDGDDWIEPDFYKLLVRSLNVYHADMAACRFVKVTDRSKMMFATAVEDLHLYSPQEALEAMFEKDKMRYSPCDKVYKRQLFSGIRYPEGNLYEDKATTYRLIHASQSVAYVSAQKYHYYVREDSIMRRPLSLKNFDIFEVNETLIDFMLDHYPDLVETAIQSYKEECAHLLNRLEAPNQGDLTPLDILMGRERCLRVMRGV